MDRPIDPEVEPYRDIIEGWRLEIASNSCFRHRPVKKESARVGLTRKQRNVLDFIQSFSDQHGKSPSYREIMTQFGMKSTAQAHWLVHKLEERGHVRFRPACARSIEVVRAA